MSITVFFVFQSIIAEHPEFNLYFFNGTKKTLDNSFKGLADLNLIMMALIPETMKMDELTPYDINKILDRMKEEGGRNGDGYRNKNSRYSAQIQLKIFSTDV